MPGYIMKRKTFLKNAAVLSAGGFAAKAVGAIYRVPLGNLLGGYAMGLYQMAYPLFCVMLTFSSAGIPNAFARIVSREAAEGKDVRGTLRSALRLFCMIGLVCTLLMLLLSPLFSALQGDAVLARCYLALAPSVFLVALIAVFRGYFQGKNDMRPTAASELLEQIVKAALGLFFALRFRDEPLRAVTYALFAVTASELVALGYLMLCCRSARAPLPMHLPAVPGRRILATALPVMAASSLLPLSQTADSILIVRLLSAHTEGAVALYGLFAGGALSLVGLSSAVCWGLAAASVPAVSALFAEGREAEGVRRALYALGVTLLLSVPCAAGLFLFARYAAAILYPALSSAQASVLVALLRTLAPAAVFLPCMQTLSACLTGMGRAKKAMLATAVAVCVKFLLEVLLLRVPSLSVLGAAIAADACYLVAFSLDLFYTVKKPNAKGEYRDHRSQSGSGKGRLERAGAGGRPPSG